MVKETEERWDVHSKDYQATYKISTKSAGYGPFSPDENELKLLGNVKGKTILELGCGGGQCSIAFAKQGAKCTAVDLSKEQIKYAIMLAKKEKVNVKFIKGDIQSLNQFKSNSYDIVFSAFAFQYVPDLNKQFNEARRVLRKNGLFVFSFDHPFNFLVSPKTLKVNKSYYKTGKFVEIEKGPDGKKHKFIFYVRKVSDIFNTLAGAGFCVEKMLEPFKFRKSDPWEKVYPEKLVKLIAPTIIFKARKL